MRRRNLLTSLLMTGLLMSCFALAAAFSGLPAPLDRIGDASLAQYGNDNDGGGSNGGNSNRDNDENNGGGGGGDASAPALRPPPAPAQAVAFGRNDCGLLRQNFAGRGNGRAFAACVSAAVQALQNPAVDPQVVCSRGLSRRRLRGERRSDYDACLLAVSRVKTSYFVRQAG